MSITVVVYKTQVWYQKMPGDPHQNAESKWRRLTLVHIYV